MSDLQWSDVAVAVESAEEYHARDGISTSKLKELTKSPEMFWRQESGQYAKEATDTMDFGSAVHEDALLEAAERSWLLIPASALTKDGKRSGNAWKAFKEAYPGRLLLKETQAQSLRNCLQAIEDNPLARQLVMDAKPNAAVRKELTVTATVSMMHPDGTLLSAEHRWRLDYLRPGVVVDLKTTGDADPESWPYRAVDQNYPMQAASYRHAAWLLDGVVRDVYFVVVENKEPFRCDVYETTERRFDEGRAKWESAIREYLTRSYEGNWRRTYAGELLRF